MKNEYELYLENKYNPKPKTQPRPKRFKTLLILSIVMIVTVGVVGATAYNTVYSYTTNTKFTTVDVQNRLFKIFNEDRSQYGVSPVTFDAELSNRSYYRAMDVRDYGVTVDKSYLHENIFVVSSEAFSRSYYHSTSQYVDLWRNTDRRFNMNELDRDNQRVGIGVTEGDGMYYIVVRWE
jgi:uncharacterized protein YkwD